MSSAITPDDIRWLPPTAAPVDGKRCPVCGDASPHAPVLDVPAMAPRGIMLSLLRCGRCGSLFYDPPDIANFSDLGGDSESFWRFYVEVGGGVWETIWPILAAARRGSLLDVGCGFGFALDFWQRSGRGEAVGLELAEYGRQGAAMLGVTIHSELLQDCAPLAGRRFDVVYASEVIEHVSDPMAFAALLAPWVADDGVLIMTTPAASFIAPENQSTTLLAALAPGFHGFLLSADAFVDAARRAGFTHVEGRTFHERQMVWASRRPLEVRPRGQGAHSAYLAYLAARVADASDTASPVWQGLAYRYGKELVSAGRAAEANAVMSGLSAAMIARFGPEILDPEAVRPRLRACATLEEYGETAPYFLPSLFFFLGALAHLERNASLALRYYAGAADCALESARFGALFFLEALSLLWPARTRHAELLLARGEIAAGVASLVRLAGEGGRCDARNGYALASRELLETTVPHWCELLWSHGRHDDARALFAAHRGYLAERYGQAILDTAGVEAALRDRTDALPLDPLYGPLFAARNQLPAPEAVAQLAAIARIGDVHADHESLGRRLRDVAQRARQLAAAPPASAAPVWSSSAHFKQPQR
ncbi:MAG TPA: class I SAM-dependent methyltransferase [Casimicrobiaceae bacterium]|nr:class I SAM-dependent methyltransferase [Casimicrobiaceae bacterium]